MKLVPYFRRINADLNSLLDYLTGQPYPFCMLSPSGASSYGINFSADKRLGQFSFLGANPFLVIKSKGRRITMIEKGQNHPSPILSPEGRGKGEGGVNYTVRQKYGDPFDELRRLLSAYAVKPGRYPAPFTGGAVGYFGYGLKRFIEKLPHRAKDDINLPDMFFGFYDNFIAIDHLTNKTWQVNLHNKFQIPNSKFQINLKSQISNPQSAPMLTNGAPRIPTGHRDAIRNPQLVSNFTKPQYLKAVRKVIDYIFAGDIYQANLSQRFQTNYTGSALELYKRLLKVNPAPFSAFLQPSGAEAIISSSPERFVKVTGDVIETRPIKGTRPRGRTPAQDRRLKQELYHSAKDNAELSMIVDLERNDVGKVCVYNSVKVTDQKVIETYPTVHHLVSTITGRLDRRYDAIDVIKATFPGGSITGAPKVRAMEIIDELEPTARNAYTGAIGYIGFDGNLDLSIAIRIFMLKSNKLYFQAGGGIVADSDPEAEYRETLTKAKGLINAIRC